MPDTLFRTRPALGALTLVLALSACQKPPAQQEEIRPVRTMLLAAASHGNTSTFAGEIRARHEADLGFRVAGKITRKLVSAGDRVRKGQVLAELDPTDYALDLAARQAQHQAATSDLAQQEADLGRARALLAQHFISQAQFDKTETATIAARARLQQARAQLEAGRNQTAYTRLIADSDGVISSIGAEPGTVVAAGQPVARLARDSEPEVAIAVPEDALKRVRDARTFDITLWANKQHYTGSLRELAAAADPATRTYAARIRIAQPDAQIGLGMTASVALAGEPRTDSYTLPLTALLEEDGQHRIWVVGAGERVGKATVTVLSLDNGQAQIRTTLPPGTRIVTAGVHLLHAQQRVRILAE